MPSVASFMMPAGKAVTACPEDKLRSVVDSLVNEKVGSVVVVDAVKAVGIITKQDVNRFFLSEVRTQPPRPRLPSLSSLNPTPPRKPPRETTRYTPRYAPIRPDTPIPTINNLSPSEYITKRQKVLVRVFSVSLLPRHPAADPTGHSREPGHEHQPAPGEARHAQGRRRGAAPARKDPPRRRRERGREVRRLVLVLGHREGVRFGRKGEPRERRAMGDALTSPVPSGVSV